VQKGILIINKIILSNKPCQLRIKAQHFGDHLRFHHQGMEVEMAPKMGFSLQLTWLVAQENVIEFSHNESFKS
jgi:hypothetical protein